MSIPARYTRFAVALHWMIAILIAINVALALSTNSVPPDDIRAVIDTHKSIGITVLGLAILRLLWRATHKPPAYPASYRPWEKALSAAAHILLYVLIFLLPLSGWMHDSAWKSAAEHPMKLYGLIPWPRISLIMNLDPATKEWMHGFFGEIHKTCARILYWLVGLHILGALKHQFFDREPELQRMLPGRGPSS